MHVNKDKDRSMQPLLQHGNPTRCWVDHAFTCITNTFCEYTTEKKNTENTSLLYIGKMLSKKTIVKSGLAVLAKLTASLLNSHKNYKKENQFA